MAGRTLTPAEAKRFYDAFGAKQDAQAFYEDAATAIGISEGRFGAASSVLEYGCGTGRFAEKLFVEELPSQAKYLGVDISETMVELARRRLDGFGSRARVERITVEDANASRLRLPAENGACDRFVSNYVFDLLSEENIRAVLEEAHRVLSPGGQIILVSLTTARGVLAKVAMGLWTALHARKPALVGGCRPLSLREHVPTSHWTLAHHTHLERFGVPSEILVATRRDPSAV